MQKKPIERVPTSQNFQTPNSQSKVRLGGIIVFITLILAAFTLLPKEENNRQSGNSSATTKIKNIFSDPAPTTAPRPFSELTIPSLRGREYKSNLGELNEVSESPDYTSYVTSYDSEGIRVNGLLTRPSGETPEGGWPAIVFIHGYIPPAQYATLGPQYADYVDYLARSGFVVFKIDLRGHGDSEGEPSGAYYSSDYIYDTLNAYAALQNTDFVNPEKIGLWGHSMAGNIVMRSLAAKPDIPAGVIWAGAVYSYTDMAKYGIRDSSYDPPDSDSVRARRRREIRKAHGEPDLDSPFWKQVAPVSYLNDLKGAVQIHHAIDDDVVRIGYARDLKNYLDDTSVRHEIIEHESGGHNITGTSFNTAMQQTAEFYKENL